MYCGDKGHICTIYDANPDFSPAYLHPPFSPQFTHVSILTTLFEPSANLQQLILPLLSSTRFDSYTGLIAAIGNQLTSLAESSSPSDTTSLDRILNAHPRLGEKNLKSVQSSGEQASLRGNQHDDEELSELNERYERAFPGLRYVYVFKQFFFGSTVY
jgi:2-oxo-4-hydroxy-4-carboxy--5-ureidoimidazoline (OHCU) decarboxylase